MAKHLEIISFWRDEVGPEGWYNSTPGLDGEISDRFGALWTEARQGLCCDWQVTAEGALALVILFDQFPRNMFRDSAKAFATDTLARKVARRAIARGFDQQVDGEMRQFFFMPLMHSEALTDQERCVRLFMTRMGEPGTSNLLHARVHREIIRRFGRFPYRNEALGRRSTADEAAFLTGNGYSRTVAALQAA